MHQKLGHLGTHAIEVGWVDNACR